MIANGLSTLIGLYLAYLSIFDMASAAGRRWQEIAAGAAIVVLARVARQSDVSGWQSGTNTVAGVLLVLAAAVSWVAPFNPLTMFWIDLWIGLLVACLALWAALYHPERAAVAPQVMPELASEALGREPSHPGA